MNGQARHNALHFRTAYPPPLLLHVTTARTTGPVFPKSGPDGAYATARGKLIAVIYDI